MKKFRFPLERLLRIRKTLEREQARLLHEHVVIADGCRQAYRNSMDERDAMVSQLGVENATPLTAGTLANLGLTVEGADDAITRCRSVLENAEENVRVEAEKYRDVRRDLRAIEKMQERQRQRWVVASLRSDQKEFDEIAGRVSSPLMGGRE